MSSVKCSYIFCGRSIRNSPGIRTFQFPVNDQFRCKQWIENSGNRDLLHLSLDKLRRRFLCQKHFKSKHFLSRKLSSSAVPVNYKLRSSEDNIFEDSVPTASDGTSNSAEEAFTSKSSWSVPGKLINDIT